MCLPMRSRTLTHALCRLTAREHGHTVRFVFTPRRAYTLTILSRTRALMSSKRKWLNLRQEAPDLLGIFEGKSESNLKANLTVEIREVCIINRQECSAKDLISFRIMQLILSSCESWKKILERSWIQQGNEANSVNSCIPNADTRIPNADTRMCVNARGVRNWIRQHLDPWHKYRCNYQGESTKRIPRHSHWQNFVPSPE